MADTRITDVMAVAVPVREQDAALAFYVGVPGFE
jgi:catechol 2,3-dioxygenase-like lactoylglutathione lyase family enzyme